VSITIPQQQGLIARAVHLPKGASMKLADQIRKGLESGGVPTGRKIEEKQPNVIAIEGRQVDTGVKPEHKTTPVGTVDAVVVINPVDAEPRAASLADMPEWVREPGAIVGGKPKAA
jgi:hypothetical protein